jgi:tRNA1Val (adenine37-N6)-methyltransferase
MCSVLTNKERSCDSLFGGDLQCVQHVDGYRFSIDPVLLGHFVRLGSAERVLDLGAGCGILGLILLYRAAEKIEKLAAFELQPGLLHLIEENISANGFHDKMVAVQGDLRQAEKYLEPESFSTVVCNPPFYSLGSGRKSSCEESEIARHEVCCTLAEVVGAAAQLVKNRGKVVMIYPASGMGTLFSLFPQYRLIVKRLQCVYSYPSAGTGARLFLVEAVKNGGPGVDVLEPLYIYRKKNGAYDTAIQQMYTAN